MARKIKKAKAVKPSEFDIPLPDEYQFKPASTPAVLGDTSPWTRARVPVPPELVPYLLPGHAPRRGCIHCGTFTAAMTNHHSDTCSCLCHAARRFDVARLKVKTP